MYKDQQPIDVFISHSSKDALVARAIKQALQNKGIRCWKAPDDILPGESWPSAIMRALSLCRVMVLVWTGNSMTSMEVSKELTLAMRNNLIVIPFRIDNIEPVGDWEYHLANTQWMNATDGLAEKHYDTLGDFLLKVLSARETHTAPVENQMSPKDLAAQVSVVSPTAAPSASPPQLPVPAASLSAYSAPMEPASSASPPQLPVPVASLSAYSTPMEPASSASPPQLPVPAASPSVYSAPREPASSSTSSPPSPVLSSSNRSMGKLIIFGVLWCGAFCFAGLVLISLLVMVFGGEAGGEPSVVLGLFIIFVMLFSPILAIWMIVKGKLPGTQKT